MFSSSEPPMYSSVHQRQEPLGQQMQSHGFIGYPPPHAPLGQYSQSLYSSPPTAAYHHSYTSYAPSYIPQARPNIPAPPLNLTKEQRSAAFERSFLPSNSFSFQDYQQYRSTETAPQMVRPKKKILAIVNPITNEIANKDTFEATANELRSPWSSVHTAAKPSSDSTLSDDFIDDDRLFPDITTLLGLEDDLSFPSFDDNGVSADEATSSKESYVQSQSSFNVSFGMSTMIDVDEARYPSTNAVQRVPLGADENATETLTNKAAKYSKWEQWMVQLKADKNEFDFTAGVFGRDFLMVCGLIVRERNKPTCPVSIDNEHCLRIDLGISHNNDWNPYWRFNERMAERERNATATVQNTLALTAVSSIEEDISAVVNAYFEKAIEDKKFFQQYSDLCKDVMLDEEKKTGARIKSHRALLSRCKAAFDPSRFQDLFDQALRAEAENDDMMRAELMNSCQKMEAKERARIFGTVGFLGHMYLEGMSPSAIVHYCIANLLLRNGEHNGDPQMIECAVRLLLKVGSRLDADSIEYQSVERVNRYYCHLRKITRKKSTSPQLRTLIDSLLERRQNNWIK